METVYAGWIGEQYYYTPRFLKKIASHYWNTKETIYNNIKQGNEWRSLVHTTADFDFALKSLSKKRRAVVKALVDAKEDAYALMKADEQLERQGVLHVQYFRRQSFRMMANFLNSTGVQ